MVVIVSVAACFALPGLAFASSVPMATTLSSLLALSTSLVVSSSFSHRDGVSENLEVLACVRLAVEDRGLHQKRREEDGVAQSSVPLLLRLREVASGGAKEDFHDR